MVTIYKLIDKKTSRIFREPVDIGVAPDYYDKIKQPIDLSTITKNIKSGTYRFAKEVLADL